MSTRQWIIIDNSGQGKVLPKEDSVSGGHVVLLRGMTAMFGVWLERIELHLQQTFKLHLTPQWYNLHNQLLQINYFKDICEPDAL